MDLLKLLKMYKVNSKVCHYLGQIQYPKFTKFIQTFHENGILNQREG